MRIATLGLAIVGGWLMAAILISPSTLSKLAPAAELANPQIDYAGFERQVNEVAAIRTPRRISEREFIELAKDPATVLLDARSAAMYKLLHVRNAVSLPFPDFTDRSLAEIIPTKQTRVLIYCNNNFRNAPQAFETKRAVASLNLHTYVLALHSYGYANVYELQPLLDRHTTKIEFAGTEVETTK